MALPMTLFVVIYVVLYTRQLEAREQAQALAAELEAANRQLAEYAAQVEDLTLAAERQRMARELHDTLAQGLAGLILQLEAARSQHRPGAQRPGRRDRRPGHGPRPLDPARGPPGHRRPARAAGCGWAIWGWPCAARPSASAAATGIPCAVEIGLVTPLPEQTSRARPAHRGRGVEQRRPARAGRARSGSARCRRPAAVEITVRDDGVGFDAGRRRARRGHYGLVGMAERARLAGGELRITSAPGQGMIVRLRVLLPASPPNRAAFGV